MEISDFYKYPAVARKMLTGIIEPRPAGEVCRGLEEEGISRDVIGQTLYDLMVTDSFVFGPKFELVLNVPVQISLPEFEPAVA